MQEHDQAIASLIKEWGEDDGNAATSCVAVTALTEAPSKTRRASSRWGINAMLIFLSALIALVFLEGAIRLFPQFQVQTGETEYHFCGAQQVRHKPHPAFGYTEAPGNVYFERNSLLDPWSFVSINAEGFRDNRDKQGQPVIVLGDSMTRGTIVNENETYVSLLDHWYSGLSFRNYGTGGYGQANEIRVYDEKSKQYPHKLVILQYSLSTDIDDNVERAVLDGNSVKINIRPIAETPKGQQKTLAKIHMFLWQHSRLYPWFYVVALKPIFSNWDARRDMGSALEITRRLLVNLNEKVKANDATLLIVVLPSWAEIAGKNDGMEPERQRRMLRHFAASNPDVSLIDMTAVLAKEDPDKTYGVIDKHLTPYGHFLVAKAMDQWLSRHLPVNAQLKDLPVRHFTPGTKIVPRCESVAFLLGQLRMGSVSK